MKAMPGCPNCNSLMYRCYIRPRDPKSGRQRMEAVGYHCSGCNTMVSDYVMVEKEGLWGTGKYWSREKRVKATL